MIEMAIVLVIIGLIVAAVTVGKDTMATAENNKVYNKFFSPWVQASYDAYNRLGTVPIACASTATCETTMANLGIDMTGTWKMTDEDGIEQSITVTSITDDRSGTGAKGGMLLTFTGAANTVDVPSITNGVLQYAAQNYGHGKADEAAYTRVDAGSTLVLRLRDIPSDNQNHL